MQVHPDHDVVAAHDGNVVVRDRVLPAVGHGEEEGLEGHFIEEVSYLPRCDHILLSFFLFRIRPGPVRSFLADEVKVAKVSSCVHHHCAFIIKK